MKLPLFQIDAFADQVFTGNPAAVVPLSAWLQDELLQSIALENNLSETAFFVADGPRFHLRWFTPEAEVDLCGHATLASAHVLFEHLGYTGAKLNFRTRSGELTVAKVQNGLSMDFPAIASEPIDAPSALLSGLGATPVEVRTAPDYLAIFGSEQEIIDLAPDFSALASLDRRGVIATAPGNDCDFVSRCFYPKLKVNEDPVTGSAHCKMAPYWANRLNKTVLVGRQLSSRGGTVHCELVGNRVILTGRAVDYLKGEIELPG